MSIRARGGTVLDAPQRSILAFMSQGHRLPSQWWVFFGGCGRTLDLWLDVTNRGTPRRCHFSCCENAEEEVEEEGGQEKMFHLHEEQNDILMLNENRRDKNKKLCRLG